MLEEELRTATLAIMTQAFLLTLLIEHCGTLLSIVAALRRRIDDAFVINFAFAHNLQRWLALWRSYVRSLTYHLRHLWVSIERRCQRPRCQLVCHHQVLLHALPHVVCPVRVFGLAGVKIERDWYTIPL